MQKRTRRSFTKDFKAEAVRLAQTSSTSVAAVARDLNLDVSTLRDWMRRAQAPDDGSSALSPSEKQELVQLRRQVRVLEMEREILIGLRHPSPALASLPSLSRLGCIICLHLLFVIYSSDDVCSPRVLVSRFRRSARYLL